MKFTVAIDGPAAAGKGTISQAVARHFGFAHLDTGLLYRAVGRLVLAGADPLTAARDLQSDDLDGKALRTAEIAQMASKIATNPDIRLALIDFQQNFARRTGGAVLDGRDIGTVICPDADVKLYVSASDNVRAQRRFQELRTKDADTDFETVLRDLRTRDARDSERATAPLKPAADAVLLDTSDMTIETAVAAAIGEVATKLKT